MDPESNAEPSGLTRHRAEMPPIEGAETTRSPQAMRVEPLASICRPSLSSVGQDVFSVSTVNPVPIFDVSSSTPIVTQIVLPPISVGSTPEVDPVAEATERSKAIVQGDPEDDSIADRRTNSRMDQYTCTRTEALVKPSEEQALTTDEDRTSNITPPEPEESHSPSSTSPSTLPSPSSPPALSPPQATPSRVALAVENRALEASSASCDNLGYEADADLTLAKTVETGGRSDSTSDRGNDVANGAATGASSSTSASPTRSPQNRIVPITDQEINQREGEREIEISRRISPLRSPQNNRIVPISDRREQERENETSTGRRCCWCSWADAVVDYPYIFIVITLLVTGLSILGLWLRGVSLPQFDATTGFEARGTEIGNAIVTRGNFDKCFIRDEVPDLRRRRKREAGSSCFDIVVDNPVFIFESIDGKSLWNVTSMRSVCELEEEILRTLPELQDDSCSVHSLPRTILELSAKSSSNCTDLSANDLDLAARVVGTCADSYNDGTLETCCKKNSGCGTVPAVCRQPSNMCASFRLIHYLMDKNFDANKLGLRNAMMIASKTSTITLSKLLDFSENELLTGNATKGHVKLVTIYFSDLYQKMFDRTIYGDMKFFGVAGAVIIVIMVMYTRSVVLTFCTVGEVGLTIIIAYFVYHVIIGLAFFPFLNVLVIPLLIGVGADDVFILNDLWHQEKTRSSSMSERLHKTLRHAAVSILVTSLTTGCSFLVNLMSSITVIKCFALFAGISLIVEFFVMVVFVPPFMVLSEKAINLWPESLTLDCSTLISYLTRIHDLFIEKIVFLIVRGKNFFLILIFAMSIAGGVLCFYEPKLKLPSSRGMQLFRDEHPFQLFESDYKDRFHGLKELRMFLEEAMPVTVYIGIESMDDGSYYDPNNKGSCKLSSDETILDRDLQLWMSKFSKEFNSQSFIHDIAKTYKRIAYDEILDMSRLPCHGKNHCCENKEDYMPNFEVCLKQFWSKVPTREKSWFVDQPMFSQDNNSNSLVAFRFVSFSHHILSPKFESMDLFYKEVNTYITKSSDLPEDAPPIWWFSVLHLYDLQLAITDGLYAAVGLSIGVASLVLFFTSWHFAIAFLSAVTIVGIVFTTVGALALMNWELNVLESMTITLAVGLSIDYIIHFGVAFKIVRAGQPVDDYVGSSFRRVGTAVSMAALTTFMAGASIMGSRVEPFLLLGRFLMLVMTISWFYSVFFFIPLLDSIMVRVDKFWLWYHGSEVSGNGNIPSVANPAYLIEARDDLDDPLDPVEVIRSAGDGEEIIDTLERSNLAFDENSLTESQRDELEKRNFEN